MKLKGSMSDNKAETLFDLSLINIELIKNGIKDLKGIDKVIFLNKYFVEIYPELDEIDIEVTLGEDDLPYEEFYDLVKRGFIGGLITYLRNVHNMTELFF